MINVEKVVRVLGYIVYTILWSPVIVLVLTVAPIAYGGMCIKNGKPIKEVFAMYKEYVANGIRHDAAFLKTGEWYPKN